MMVSFLRNVRIVSLLLLLVITDLKHISCGRSADHHNEYLHEWAVQVHDSAEADLIAMETGFTNRGPVSFQMKIPPPNYIRTKFI